MIGVTRSQDFPQTQDPTTYPPQVAIPFTATFSGGLPPQARVFVSSPDQRADAITHDATGDLYVAGSTSDASVTSHKTYGSSSAFVFKYGEDGSGPLYSTYIIDGDLRPEINDIAVDRSGNLFFTGKTQSYGILGSLSPDGSTLNLRQIGLPGVNNAFEGTALYVSSQGEIYVAGNTPDGMLNATSGAYDTTYNGGIDGYLVKYPSLFGDPIYATYFGGHGEDKIHDLVVDDRGFAFLAGSTRSPNLPVTPRAVQNVYRGVMDGFVACISFYGTHLNCSSYLGGSSADLFSSIALDSDDDLVLAGETFSRFFPIAGAALQPTHQGGQDGILVRLSRDATQLRYSSYFGGRGDDRMTGLALTEADEPIIAGITTSDNLPTAGQAIDHFYNGDEDGFLAHVSRAGNRLRYASYLGGSNDDQLSAMTLDDQGVATVCGTTSSFDIFTTGDLMNRGQTEGTAFFISHLPIVCRTEVYDMDLNQRIDLIDLLLLMDQIGPCSLSQQCPGDLDGDGLIGPGDLGLMYATWRVGCPN